MSAKQGANRTKDGRFCSKPGRKPTLEQVAKRAARAAGGGSPEDALITNVKHAHDVLTTSGEIEEAVREMNAMIFAPPDKAEKKEIKLRDPKVVSQLQSLVGLGHRMDEPARGTIYPEGTESREMRVREWLMYSLLKIRDKQGTLLPLLLNRAQADFDRSWGKHSIVLKARQLGITTYVAARFFLNCITRPGTLSVQVAHDQQSAEEIFRIVHRLLANLPWRMRKGALMTSRANVRQIVFPHLDSEYRVETAADPNAGRGLTIHNLHCSEVARWPRDAAETLASLRAAVPPDGEIVLESTPFGAVGPFYEEWQRAAETGYTRHFYPWWWEPSYRRPAGTTDFTEPELELIEKHGLTTEQIAFRREMRANFTGRAPQEYCEDAQRCFLASGECMFDVEIVQARLSAAPPPFSCTDLNRIQRWLPPMTENNAPRDYILGVDPAGGGCDGDYACAQVIERTTGKQCAELRGHYSPKELAVRVVNLAKEYHHARVAVERNNHGHEVLAHVMDYENYSNVYRMNHQAGWLTTVTSRRQMLDSLAAMVTERPQLFQSELLLRECKSFVRQADGNYAAARGAHDDTVMAMAIAQAVRSEEAKEPSWAKKEPTTAEEPEREKQPEAELALTG